jgi:hypothetical protein
MPSPGKIGFWFIPPPPPALEDFPNPGFEEGLIYWQVINTRIQLNGGTTILGWPTPTDPTPNPQNFQGGLVSVMPQVSKMKNTVFH